MEALVKLMIIVILNIAIALFVIVRIYRSEHLRLEIKSVLYLISVLFPILDLLAFLIFAKPKYQSQKEFD